MILINTNGYEVVSFQKSTDDSTFISDLHQLVRFVICSLAHVKIVVNVAEACSVKLEKLSSDIFEDLIKLQVSFI